MAVRYRADPAAALIQIELDDLTLIYQRSSAQTHVVAPPVPQILDALADAPMTLVELRDRLAALFDVSGSGDLDAVLAARLDELVETGLVSLA